MRAFVKKVERQMDIDNQTNGKDVNPFEGSDWIRVLLYNSVRQ
jgi:hypothetical protein